MLSDKTDAAVNEKRGLPPTSRALFSSRFHIDQDKYLLYNLYITYKREACYA